MIPLSSLKVFFLSDGYQIPRGVCFGGMTTPPALMPPSDVAHFDKQYLYFSILWQCKWRNRHPNHVSVLKHWVMYTGPLSFLVTWSLRSTVWHPPFWLSVYWFRMAQIPNFLCYKHFDTQLSCLDKGETFL